VESLWGVLGGCGEGSCGIEKWGYQEQARKMDVQDTVFLSEDQGHVVHGAILYVRISFRYQAIKAHVRQSGPYPGSGIQVQLL